MNIFLVSEQGELVLQKGSQLIVEFDNGMRLELSESPTPLPPTIPHGLSIRSDCQPPAPLNITPVAANGIVVALSQENSVGITMLIADAAHCLQTVKGNNVLIRLNNGKTLEVMEDYARRGLLIWGGREPIPGLPMDEVKARTESLGLYPLASNLIHLFPWQLE